jgi:Sulfotransferase domain
MMLLSVGMPRAGSGWHYNLIQDLMKTAGWADAREIRRRFHLETVLTDVNCNIGVLSARRLGLVVLPALLGNSFVIKAHAGPTSASRLLSKLGILRITYIYRDPRDCMLSAFDYGERALTRGRPNAFSHLTDFDTSLAFILDYVRIWEKWTHEKNVLIARYEDLLMEYDKQSARLVGYLGLNEDQPKVHEVIEHYRPGSLEGQPGTHFFKGKIGRFRDAYSADQQRQLTHRLGSFLAEMGYPV